jgi:hypothetical protein
LGQVGHEALIGAGVGAVTSGLAGLASVARAAQAIPRRMARVIPAEFAGGARLAGPRATEAWVTGAEDLAGIASSEGLAQRLTLVDQAGNLISGPPAVIEFDVVTEGLASPVLRDTPGFVVQGFTRGGAREFIIPNLEINQLRNIAIRFVP